MSDGVRRRNGFDAKTKHTWLRDEIKMKPRTVAGRGEKSLLCDTPDLSYELEGERKEDVAKIINGMRKKKKKKDGRTQRPAATGLPPQARHKTHMDIYISRARTTRICSNNRAVSRASCGRVWLSLVGESISGFGYRCSPFREPKPQPRPLSCLSGVMWGTVGPCAWK